MLILTHPLVLLIEYCVLIATHPTFNITNPNPQHLHQVRQQKNLPNR